MCDILTLLCLFICGGLVVTLMKVIIASTIYIVIHATIELHNSCILHTRVEL